MCKLRKVVENISGTGQTETITGILKETNTLDGKPLIKRR